ncbi:MAG: GNAT family N-acetyltransferase [Chitinophagales bacterium]
MQVRLAVEKDVESLVDLWIELMDYHAAFSIQFLINKNKRAAIEALLMEMLSKKQTHVYIMESDEKIVAMLIARIDVKPEMFTHPKSGYVAETVVTKLFRGKDIGSELVTAAHQWFQSEGVDYVELQVSSGNSSGVAFWKSKGYELQTLRMIRPVKK